ncbi:MAG: hypothetical protein JOY58_17125 [Solirubrobacterales bacterium]|nr:hypothetical protein [Solirubrobacterales bacterium]
MQGRLRFRLSVSWWLALLVSLLLTLIALSPSAASAATAAQCTNDVTFGLIEATTTGCLNQVSPGTWQTTDTVNLNGIPLTPAPHTELVLTSPTPSSPGGRLSVKATFVVAGVKFDGGLLNWDLPAGGKGEEKNVVSTGKLNGEKLFGFPISGSAEIRIGWDARNNLRYFKFIANLALPSIFKNGPEQGAGGLTATVGLRVDSAGVHADAVKAEVSNAYIGTLQVKSLCLSFVAAGSTTTPCSPPLHGAEPLLTCESPGNVDRWDGSAEIVLPTADKPEIGVWAGVQNGMFSYAGGQATHLGQSVPLATGVYLDNVGLALCVTPPPIKFKGAMGIGVGPAINGSSPVTINGSIEYDDTNPWLIEARGNVELFGYRVADGFISYRSDNTIDFGFHANLDFKVVSLEASLSGWVEARNPFRFNVDGSGRICVLSVACLGGEVTASSEGLAACITIMEGDVWTYVKDPDWAWYALWRAHWELRHWRLRAGAGIHWSGGGVQLMGDSCDVGPYRAAKSAQASAAGVYSMQVAPGSTALTLQAQGKFAAPGLVLISPNGTRYASPRDAAKIVENRDMFAKDPQNHTTDVMIANPQAGLWRIRADRGSTITGVRQASVDPTPTVDAGVGGSGDHRILGYTFQPQPQHSTRFVEDGPKYEQELGTATGGRCRLVKYIHPDPPRCGEIHFTPAPGPAGVRQIYAITTMNGEITDKQLVATYDAPAEPEPSMVPELLVQRVPDGITISFKPSGAPIQTAKPIDYNIDVNLTDGRELLEVLPSRDHKITITNVASTVGAQVRIAGMREDDTQGRTRAVILAPEKLGAFS